MFFYVYLNKVEFANVFCGKIPSNTKNIKIKIDSTCSFCNNINSITHFFLQNFFVTPISIGSQMCITCISHLFKGVQADNSLVILQLRAIKWLINYQDDSNSVLTDILYNLQFYLPFNNLDNKFPVWYLAREIYHQMHTNAKQLPFNHIFDIE